ncbi:MAG: M20/M25/M40 family metallo-hydrolase [Gemmataceae bacterium]|nr:M20/M25/M40 family metallo-hydrolase [Gemmataceae bacterium]MCI0742376.1 M20/M25/M40 family metallo-hydrolase [Gemmataceae bacterium]
MFRPLALFRRRPIVPAVLLLGALASFALAQQEEAKVAEKSPEAIKAALELDQKIIAEVKKGSEILSNLSHLSDIIGPRLTGSAALKRANDWTADRMKAYGLSNVKLERWSLPEGWQRGTAYAKIIEPDNGRSLTLASMGWYPGTKGKITGDVVVIQAKTIAELKKYEGKLKGAIVLRNPPSKLTPWMDIEKAGGRPFAADGFPKKGEEGKGKFGDGKFQPEAFQAMTKAVRELLTKEGAAVLLTDSAKHFNLLATTGSWGGADRPSADNRIPTCYMAHEHYALLYRLATRPEPAVTKVEVDITNTFVPGPIAVYNTVGEIRGSEKPDEFVILGAHLDSWDLGQGTLDNGTGSSVVLEAARALAKCGVQPKRTIRFILFTGEEQGLHGSKAYVTQHKNEVDKISTAIVHDTGTGKVVGLGWGNRPGLKPILESELATLKELGVAEFQRRAGSGSDHMSFERAGIPACFFSQEIAGYRFAHHSQADTMTLVREPDLIQGAQVMAVMAMRFANLETMLPRAKK